MEDTQNTQGMSQNSGVDARWVIAGVVILLVMLNIQNKQSQLKSADNLDDQARAQAVAQKEIVELVAKLSQFVVLPENDEPALAVVNDASKIANQAPFFRIAQNGDKLLIFPKSGQAILYRPEVEKIVGMATVFTPTAVDQTDDE